jgi:hypothetical protein
VRRRPAHDGLGGPQVEAIRVPINLDNLFPAELPAIRVANESKLFVAYQLSPAMSSTARSAMP